MRTEVSPEKIQAELNSVIKPTPLVAGLEGYPYKNLDDRDFEILVYTLLKDEFSKSEHNNKIAVSLMQGVGERGRDIVLSSSLGPTGVVQCKNLAQRVTKPGACKEIIKFAIHSIIDESLTSGRTEFEYHMYAPAGYTEDAQKFFDSHCSIIDNDVTSGKFQELVSAVVNYYESFSFLRENPPIEEIAKRIKSFKLFKFDANDLNIRLSNNHRVASCFFRVKLYIDSDSITPAIEAALEKYGLSLLTDEHLIDIKQRISGIPASKRVSLGNMDIFGYDRDIYAYFTNSEFEDLLKRVEAVRQFFTTKIVNIISDKVMALMYERITIPLLHTYKAHSFTASIIGQYLIKTVLPVFMKGLIPPDEYERKHGDPEATFTELVKENIDSIFKFIHGDYSIFPNPDPDREKRIALMQNLSNGINSEADAQSIIDRDMKILGPIVDGIIKDICDMTDENRTIIIKDKLFFADKESFHKVFSELENLKIGKGSATPFMDSVQGSNRSLPK